jgi:hypothetical protein
MNDSTSAKRTVASVISDATKIRDRQRAVVTEQTKAFAQSNVFAQILLNQELSPEAKRDAFVRELSFSKDATKEQNRARLEAFSAFKEYLQEQRKILNREGIKLQDTEAFAELQAVVDEMTRASLEFQERAKPLIDVLAAVFEIRKNDKIPDVYKEIQRDKEWAEEQDKKLKDHQERLQSLMEEADNLERQKAQLSAERSFFGFGPTKKTALARIAEIDAVDKARVTHEIDERVSAIDAQKATIQAGRDPEHPELAEQKRVLREFLDLTKDENRERQRALIDAAVNYVDTSDTRLKSVLGTLERLGKHAEVLADTNGILKNMHLIMDESLKEVAQKNESTKKDLESGGSEESSIARMTRENKLQEINEFISRADDHSVDVANSIGGLTKHAVQIQAYKDTIRNESGSTKRLHLEGVSQMGEQLMSVISAISAAATSESRSVAANNFARMAAQNQTIIAQEVVRNATNVDLEAQQISRLVGELQDYGDVLKASSDIAQEGYSRMRETIGAIRKVSGAVQGAINDLVDDRAEANMGSGEASAGEGASKAESSFQNPFDKLGNS